MTGLEKKCIDCGYILEGLTEHRCPECSRAFDPTDAKTYATRTLDGRVYLLLAVVGALPVVLGLTASYMNDLGMLSLRGTVGTGLLILAGPWAWAAGLGIEFWVLGRSGKALFRDRGRVGHKRLMTAAWGLSLAVVIGFFGLMAISLLVRLIR